MDNRTIKKAWACRASWAGRASGISRASGPAGLPGRQGLPGQQGFPDRQGLPGRAGAPGPAGSAGPAGPQGIQGIQGLPGVTLPETPFADSEILDEVLQTRLNALYGNPFQTWTLCYRMTDGDASVFHATCDNQGPTITVLKTEAGKILGGYNELDWQSSVWLRRQLRDLSCSPSTRIVAIPSGLDQEWPHVRPIIAWTGQLSAAVSTSI